MVNTPQTPENINKNITPNKDELLNTLSEETKTFSCKLEFIGLEYEERREKVENVVDELIDFLYKEKIHKWNTVMHLFKEIIKNSADHSSSDMQINIELKKDTTSPKKIEIEFFLYDGWPGISYEESDIKNFFDTGESPPNWQKKGKNNFWVWLGIIKAVADQCTIDLILHNQWKKIYLNDIWLQKDVKAQDKFWYEWYGVFDIIEK